MKCNTKRETSGWTLIALAAVLTGCQWGGTTGPQEAFTPNQDEDRAILPDFGVDLVDRRGDDGGTPPPPPPPGTEPIDAEVLFILDRSQEMRFAPDSSDTGDLADSKVWGMASSVQVLADEFADLIPLGVAFFPRDPGPNNNDRERCVTFAEKVGGLDPINNGCQDGEVAVELGGAELLAAINPSELRMCRSTPIAKGLVAARTAFSAADVPKFAILISDGKESCQTRARLVQRAEELASDGVQLFVIGYGASDDDLDTTNLNRLACVGGRAPTRACDDEEPTGDGDAFVRATDEAELTLMLRYVFVAIQSISSNQ